MLLYLIFEGQLSVGEIITLQFYSFFIFGPLQEVGNVIISYREAEASLANFEQIMNTPLEPKPSSPKHLGTIQNMRFNDVVFRHKSAGYDAVSKISFDVNKGETIAFVGPSGSGKSTLVKLLVGLYSPNSGNILYNNIVSTEIDKDELQQQLGFVTQDTQLFSGTIKENLLFVKPDSTDAELEDVLEKSACSNIIKRSENGLDTMIGEGGMKLSGGEKQRVSIACALATEPRFIVCDEPVSALDVSVQAAIVNLLSDLRDRLQVAYLFISHDISVVAHLADRIAVMKNGQIVEIGDTRTIIEQPSHPYTIKLLSAVPSLERRSSAY
jgi:ATP-binding cassette subfamily B protein